MRTIRVVRDGSPHPVPGAAPPASLRAGGAAVPLDVEGGAALIRARDLDRIGAGVERAALHDASGHVANVRILKNPRA